MMMPIWTQSFPQIIGTKIQPDLEKTTAQKNQKLAKEDEQLDFVW
jgi:hypothetical protein